MVKRTVLQVPIKAELRAKAEKKADAEGFSSLQEVVRFMLSRYSSDELVIKVSDKAADRYEKMISDAKKGKNISKPFDNVDDLMADLMKK
jgi:hypothetical protein